MKTREPCPHFRIPLPHMVIDGRDWCSLCGRPLDEETEDDEAPVAERQPGPYSGT